MYRLGRFIASAMLVVALFDLPYGYYEMLRLVVCTVAVYGAYLSIEKDLTYWATTLVGVALLYNPIATVGLTREIWSVLNIITIGVFLFSGGVEDGPEDLDQSDVEESPLDQSAESQQKRDGQ